MRQQGSNEQKQAHKYNRGCLLRHTFHYTKCKFCIMKGSEIGVNNAIRVYMAILSIVRCCHAQLSHRAKIQHFVYIAKR